MAAQSENQEAMYNQSDRDVDSPLIRSHYVSVRVARNLFTRPQLVRQLVTPRLLHIIVIITLTQ